MDRVTMTIDGMSCGHCVMSVRNALQAIEGVEIEEVKVGAATVAFDPSATSAERLRQAVEEEGYAVVAAS
jgi:copper chaperone